MVHHNFKVSLIAFSIAFASMGECAILSLNQLGQAISADTSAIVKDYNTLRNVALFRRQVLQLSKTDSRYRYPSGRKVFYPFGGADVFFPGVFFPDAERLVIVARETIKPIPEVDSNDQFKLGGLRAAINDAFNRELLRFSFMKTDDSARKISEGIGMATALVGAMSAQGYNLINVVYFTEIICSESGCSPVATLKPNSATRIIGVEVSYVKPGESAPKTIAYFNEDLSNDPEKYRDPNFLAYLEQERFDTTYYKAASYLSQLPNFSKINKVALKSKFIVQSDCGLPFSSFVNGGEWKVNLYGNYKGVDSSTFNYVKSQEDLRIAYQNSMNQSSVLNNVFYGFDTTLYYDYAGVQSRTKKFNLLIAFRSD